MVVVVGNRKLPASGFCTATDGRNQVQMSWPPLVLITMPSKEARQKALALQIFQTIQNSSYLQSILVTATSDAQKAFFIGELLSTVPGAFSGQSEPPCGLFNIMTIWFGKYNDGLSFSDVEDALNKRKNYFTVQRHRKTDFIQEIGLDWSPDTRDAFLEAIRTISLVKLDTPLSYSQALDM